MFIDSENFLNFEPLWEHRTESEKLYGHDHERQLYKLIWTTDGTETPDWDMPSARMMTWQQEGDVLNGHQNEQTKLKFVKLEGLSWPWAIKFDGLHITKNPFPKPSLLNGIEGESWFYSVGYKTAWHGGQPGYTITGAKEDSITASKVQLFKCAADDGTKNLF